MRHLRLAFVGQPLILPHHTEARVALSELGKQEHMELKRISPIGHYETLASRTLKLNGRSNGQTSTLRVA